MLRGQAFQISSKGQKYNVHISNFLSTNNFNKSWLNHCIIIWKFGACLFLLLYGVIEKVLKLYIVQRRNLILQSFISVNCWSQKEVCQRLIIPQHLLRREHTLLNKITNYICPLEGILWIRSMLWATLRVRSAVVCISIFALRLMKMHELRHLQILFFVFKCLF